jgi:DNA mismatch endonuclease, patch repair protein
VVDSISSKRRSENMRRILSKDMSPEMSVRRLLHSMGYRYRLHRKSLPGHPDIVFPTQKKVIFVHGCFWHQHADPRCKIKRVPKSRLEYWLPKLSRNAERDQESIALLKGLGWKVLVIWECQTPHVSQLSSKLSRFLSRKES